MNPLSVIASTFHEVLYRPIINVLVFFVHQGDAFHLPGALGLSIVLLTILIRLLVWPFMSTQIRSARKLTELKPHLDALKKKHKDDKKALGEAQMALYKEHNYNPAGGCLPSLVQLAVVWALAQAVPTLFNSNGLQTVNALLYPGNAALAVSPDPHFLGMDLSSKLAALPVFSSEWTMLLAVPLITAALTFVQAKMMSPKPVKVYLGDSPKEVKEKEEVEDTATAVQSQMMYMMPVMIGVFAYQLPIGLALYWNTMTIMGILQQYIISGWGGLNLKKLF
jgi:YidC/Oxa1 family membrane protein insertase